MLAVITILASLLLISSATNPTERLLQWRTSAAFAGYHTATVAPGTSVRLSCYCGDGMVFPSLSSRTQANNAAKKGELLLNGMEVHGAARVSAGDVLTLRVPALPAMQSAEVQRVKRFYHELTKAKPERGGRLAVLHEDEDVALVFKPPGVHSTPWAGTRKNWGDLTLCDALPLLLAAPHSGGSDDSDLSTVPAPLPAPVPAHRLDARVGGVLAVAKSRRALSGFSRLFKERRVTKRYSAVVVGKVCLEDLDSDESSGGDKGRGGGGGSGTSSRGSDSVGGAFGQFRYSLVRSGDASGEASVASGEANGDADGEAGGGASEDCAILRLEQIDAEGRVSRTEIRVVDVTPCSVHGALTTLDLRPISGRRHQLRIACAVGLGTPIVGDDLYHDEAQAVRRARQLPALPPVRRKAGLFLQAVEISLPHPITGDELRAHAPEMGRFDKLRERAASGAGYSEAEWEAWRAA